MTDLQKRILAGGFLALCLLSLFWTDYRDRKIIGLSELVALCGSWACAVWLWKPTYTAALLSWRAAFTPYFLLFCKIAGRGIMLLSGITAVVIIALLSSSMRLQAGMGLIIALAFFMLGLGLDMFADYSRRKK